MPQKIWFYEIEFCGLSSCESGFIEDIAIAPSIELLMFIITDVNGKDHYIS